MGAGLYMYTELMRYAHAKQGLKNNNYLSYTHEHNSSTHTHTHTHKASHHTNSFQIYKGQKIITMSA